MKKITIALVVLAVVAIATYYLVFSTDVARAPENSMYDYDTASPANDDAQNAMPADQNAAPVGAESNLKASVTAPKVTAPESVTIHIKNFAFSPSTISVKAGTKVTWINDDSAPHTVTSDSGSLLGSNTLSAGQSYSVSLTDAGTFSYHCNFHPMMKGKVVVQ